jgi:hypothetical protein
MIFAGMSVRRDTDASALRLRRLRTVFGRGAVVVAMGTALLGSGASIALADEGRPAPPSGAYAAPSSNIVAATGSGRNYWASDYCHYFQQDGGWRSDQCMRVLPDANGQPTSYVGNFQNLGDSNLGRELVRLDLGMPGYVGFAAIQPNGQPGAWVRFEINNPRHVQVLGQTNTDQPIWVDMPTQQTAPAGGTQSGYVSNPAQAGYWQLLGKLTQTNQEVLAETIGIVHYTHY